MVAISEHIENDNNLDRLYVYGNYIDEVLYCRNIMTKGPNPPSTIWYMEHYYAHNHLFSVCALLNDTGSIAERYEYNAYGKLTIWNSTFTTTSTTSSYNNPYYFTGRRLDTLDSDNLEIMYYRNRYYSCEMGRFITDDPLEYEDGLNLYQYVMSNPKIYLDPDGLKKKCGECTPPTDGSPNAFNHEIVNFGRSTGMVNPKAIDDGLMGIARFRKLTFVIGLLKLSIKSDLDALAKWLVKRGYVKTIGDAKKLIEQAKKIRDGMIDARRGYYLWIEVKYDKCVPCKHIFKDCGKSKYKSKKKWIPCATNTRKNPAGTGTLPGMVPKIKNDNYPRDEAIIDALSYCRVAAEDPENAPTMRDDEFGRIDLIRRGRQGQIKERNMKSYD